MEITHFLVFSITLKARIFFVKFGVFFHPKSKNYFFFLAFTTNAVGQRFTNINGFGIWGPH